MTKQHEYLYDSRIRPRKKSAWVQGQSGHITARNMEEAMEKALDMHPPAHGNLIPKGSIQTLWVKAGMDDPYRMETERVSDGERWNAWRSWQDVFDD